MHSLFLKLQKEIFSSFLDFSSTERELIRALIEKEDWAYRELIVAWSEKLYQLIFRFLRRTEEAQEVLQETFKKVFENIKNFKGESKLQTWLYRIATNEALMRIRSNRSQAVAWEDYTPHYQDEVIIDKIPDWSNLPEEKLIEEEGKKFVQDCLNELSAEYRSAYLLKDIEELSENEVVEILNISKSTMKIRVHRARLFLREKIQKKYVTQN